MLGRKLLYLIIFFWIAQNSRTELQLTTTKMIYKEIIWSNIISINSMKEKKLTTQDLYVWTHEGTIYAHIHSRLLSYVKITTNVLKVSSIL